MSIRAFSTSGSFRRIPVLLLMLGAVLAVACSSREASQQAKMIVRSLQASDLKVGTGATAEPGQTVTVDYTVWLYDSTQPERKGRKLDSTLDRHQPLTFKLGAGDVIAAWDDALPEMRVGGARELFVPPALAYGDRAEGPIPPGATLVYDITLLAVKK